MYLVQMRLSDLVLDERCQMRLVFSEDYALELADYLREGGTLPPLVAFREGPRGPPRLADGWHRRRAREILEQKYAEVDVRAGGLRDAALFAAGCNGKSPLRPRPEDYRKAAVTLLLDAEWGKRSAREIARFVGCGRDMVARLRDGLADLSGAKGQIGLDGLTVERGGTTYTMRFRDMTPAALAGAVGAETERHAPAWRREAAAGLEQAERALVCLGEAHAEALALTRGALAECRRVEKARAAA